MKLSKEREDEIFHLATQDVVLNVVSGSENKPQAIQDMARVVLGVPNGVDIVHIPDPLQTEVLAAMRHIRNNVE